MNPTKFSRIFLNLGAVLEYYDYLIFIFLAKILITVFFPSIEQGNFTINFLFFTLGSAVKIIGGLGFGYLSDIFGRKKVILSMSILMATSTIGMGLMPYNLDVKLYIVLFFGLRILQALSFGGEIPCATTFAYELENDNKKNSRVSHIFSAAAVGSIIATGVLSFLTFSLNMNQVNAWGWRIPFLVGGVLGILSFFLRKSLPETLMQGSNSNNLREILTLSKFYIKDIVTLPAILLFPATLISVNLYFPMYVSRHFNFGVDKIYLAQSISLIFSACVALVAGIFSDKKRIKNMYMILLVTFLGTHPFLIKLLTHHTTASLIWFMVLWQFFITVGIVFAMFLILETLPMKIRATANGFIYNLAFFTASFVPLIFNKFYSAYADPYILFTIICAVCSVSLLGILRVFIVPQKYV
jgi:MFS family permease